MIVQPSSRVKWRLYYGLTPLEYYPDSAWDKVLGVNVKGIFNLTLALLNDLEAAGAGTDDDPAKVINVGSVQRFVSPIFESYAYSASKAAVRQLTRHMAKHLGFFRRIVINAIAPGSFPGRMMGGIIEERGEELVRMTATGRLGRADDMAGVAVSLASRAGANVTGHLFRLMVAMGLRARLH